MSITGGSSFAVHPEHVQLAILISALVSPPSYQMGWGVGFDAPTAQRLLALYLLEEIQDVSVPTLTPLPALITSLEQQLGQAGIVLASAVVLTLRSLTSPDDVLNLFKDFSTMLAPPGSTPAAATDACSIPYIATSSPLGLFLRRVRVGLNSMSVQGLAVLAAQIQRQVQQVDARQAAATAAASDWNTGALKEKSVLEAYVNQLLSAVESQGASLPASVVEAATAQLAELDLELPKLQYLRLAVSLAHKDLHAALTSLHKYFDSNGSAVGPATALPGTVGSAAAAAGGGGSRSKGRHQAALHSLAALHAHFGHPQEARAAVQEVLRLGQQHGDEWGLMHALAGLCRVMGMSEGLQQQGSSSCDITAPASLSAGWGLLDFRRTEQLLQLQALLRRCLNTARDVRAPHIAAFAAVALCRFGQQHASAAGEAVGNSGDENLTAEAAVAASNSTVADGGGSSSMATAATSVMIQRMLLDVATLQHQAAIAAAAPGTPAVAVAAPAAAQQGGAVGLATRNTDLYNPTEAFGTGTSATPGSVSGAPAASKQQAPGLGWHAAAAAVSQGLATAHLVAAAGLAQHGATSLAAVRLLMLLTGPGGAGTAAETYSTAGQRQQTQECNSSELQGHQQQQQHLPGRGGTAAQHVTRPHQLALLQSAVGTGCGVRFEDIAAGWGLLTELATNLQGVCAGQLALSLALAHFPGHVVPQPLAAAQQQLQLQAALNCEDLPAAQLACQELQCLAPTLPQLGVEVQLAAAKADALMHAVAGCWADAHAAAASLFATAAAAGMQPQAVDALLMMSRACYAAGDLAGSLPCALSALLHCQQLRLDAKLPEAVLLLAAAWQGLEAGISGVCLQMLQQVLPLAYSCGSVKLQAELEEALAKAELHLAQQDGTVQCRGASAAVEQKTAETLDAVAQRLTAAAALYEQAEAWPAASCAWMMLAHALNAAGHEAKRNHAAFRWHAAQQQLGTLILQ